jgi:hypothetical protein
MKKTRMKGKCPFNWSDLELELSGDEGFGCRELVVTGHKVGTDKSRRLFNSLPIRVFVKVVGFQDNRSPTRNWGVQKLE